MNRYAKRVTALAACLSALAGYVDAIGFLSLGGFFVSFMSGNSTRLAVGLGTGSSATALLAATLIGSFVAGVVAGSMAGQSAGVHRHSAVLLLVAGLLGLAAWLGGNGASAHTTAILMALAMGAENCVFERDGEVHIGLTYMTGTLVKLGQRLAAALRGGTSWAWLPYLLLWAGLAAGAVAGALVFPRIGIAALWPAAGTALLLAGVATRLRGHW